MNNRPSSVTAQPERRAGHASRKKKLQKAKRRARAASKTSESLTNTGTAVSTPKPVKGMTAPEFSGWFIGQMQPGKFSPCRAFRMETLQSNGRLSGQVVRIYVKNEESAQTMRDAPERERVILTGVTPAAGGKPYLSTGSDFSVRVGALSERQLRAGVNTSSGGRYAHEWGYVK